MARSDMRWSRLALILVGLADLCLRQVLEEYAADHNGAFPGSQPTPEAALSLLYPKYATAYLLAGKSVPESRAKAVLERDEPLGPQSCGWHYVQGLHIDDDPRLALFWDIPGLGHNGQRLSGGGHTVLFLGGERRHVSAEDWPSFLQEQQNLLTVRGGPGEVRIDATGQLQGERVQVQLRVVDGYVYARVWRGGRFSSGESLAHVDRAPTHGLVGLPIVSASELRDAKVVFGQGQINFILKGRDIVFTGSGFRFEESRF